MCVFALSHVHTLSLYWYYGVYERTYHCYILLLKTLKAVQNSERRYLSLHVFSSLEDDKKRIDGHEAGNEMIIRCKCRRIRDTPRTKNLPLSLLNNKSINEINSLVGVGGRGWEFERRREVSLIYFLREHIFMYTLIMNPISLIIKSFCTQRREQDSSKWTTTNSPQVSVSSSS